MKTKIKLKYVLAGLIIFLGWMSFGVFWILELRKITVFPLSNFSLVVAGISFSWIVYSNKGKLHPKFRKTFWIFSLALLMLILIFSFFTFQINFGEEGSHFFRGFITSMILLIIFIFIIDIKNKKIEKKELKSKQEKEWEDSKPLHEKALHFLYTTYELEASIEDKESFDQTKDILNLLKSRGFFTIIPSYKKEHYAIIITQENLANLNRKINVPEFLEADFSDKNQIEKYSKLLFK